MSSSTNPPDPYGAGDQSGSDRTSGSGSTPPPYGSTPPPYGATPPAYGSAPQPYGSPPPPPYGSTPSGYGATPPSYAGGYGTAPYGQGGAGGYGYSRNSLAVWSLVLSLVGFFVCGLLTAIPGLVLGYRARKAVAAGEANNGGMATAGIIISWVTIALWLVLLLWLFAFGGLAAYLELIESTSTGTSSF